MDVWLKLFIAVTALAVVSQTVILLVLYLRFRQMSERMNRMATDLHTRVAPILSRLQVLVEDVQPRITSMVVNAADITHLARTQAQKMDRVFTEAADRLRMQLIQVDRIVTGALETIEEVGTQFRRTLWGPAQQASAFIKGVKTGLEFFRSRRSPGETRADSQQDEGLFI